MKTSRLAGLVFLLAAAVPGSAQQPADPATSGAPAASAAPAAAPAAHAPLDVSIASPKADETLAVPDGAKGAKVVVKIDVKGVAAHDTVGFLLNNGGAVFLKDASKGWTYPALPAGSYRVRAFVLDGEKNLVPGSRKDLTFHVGARKADALPADGDPFLTVFQPSGKYSKTEAAKLQFEFEVSGCRLGKEPGDCQVQYKLDEQPDAVVYTSDAIHFENLAPGKHSVRVGLLKDGKFAAGPFNSVRAAFEIVDGAAPAEAPKAN